MPHCWKSHALAHMHCVRFNRNIQQGWFGHRIIVLVMSEIFQPPQLTPLDRGSYMSVHVLLNLLNELRKRDKMRGLPSILSLFRNEFNKFNNTRARMLDSFYHMTLRYL